MTAAILKQRLKAKAKPAKAKVLQSFFKTGPGEYGHGDIFLGVTMPEIRVIAVEFVSISPVELIPLLGSPLHEERMLALVILTLQFKKAQSKNDALSMRATFDFYLNHRSAINNWDLVDVTAPAIVGGYLFDRDRRLLRQLSGSEDLWERRIAIVSTFYFIRLNDFEETLWISKKLLNDQHDLIHKATGWMLREIGKRNESVLLNFLNQNSAKMPRTMLRYAIERLPEKMRATYLGKKRRGSSR